MAWRNTSTGQSGGAGHRRDGSVVGRGIQINRSRAEAVVRGAEGITRQAAVRHVLDTDQSWLFAEDFNQWLKDRL